MKQVDCAQGSGGDVGRSTAATLHQGVDGFPGWFGTDTNHLGDLSRKLEQSSLRDIAKHEVTARGAAIIDICAKETEERIRWRRPSGRSALPIGGLEGL